MTQADLDLAFSDLTRSHKLVCEALDRVQGRSTEQLLEYRELKRKFEIVVAVLRKIEGDVESPDQAARSVLAEIGESK
jgi:hypothetical protein